ncbi:MAG: hypothetical protein C7B46_09895 [Sulfobacillus benefaciens]|uniref:Uncharacterized protein n=1 Tax=Sulfobacillus benefaciens TaxID=453960 RepID=A0A2T2XG32_9FIRM|nr:MAG: hypothetical protein C7B46_09895 [Sulfobacillus benefaciens]
MADPDLGSGDAGTAIRGATGSARWWIPGTAFSKPISTPGPIGFALAIAMAQLVIKTVNVRYNVCWPPGIPGPVHFARQGLG